MKKAIRVKLSPEAEEVYKYLDKESSSSKTERMILNAVRKKVELIKANPHYGSPISKNKIPTSYKKQYGVSNLFHVKLPSAWRMLYSLIEGETEVEIIAFVLDISDHKKYDKKFGYKKQ
jgi:hypothetical protein